MELHSPITQLPRVGPTRAKGLARLGIVTVNDLLCHLPRGYDDRTHYHPIATAPSGEGLCIRAMVTAPPQLHRIRGTMELTKVKVVDDSGALHLTFFNRSRVRHALIPGKTYIFFGTIDRFSGYPSMVNPLFEEEGVNQITGRLVPIYPLTQGITGNFLMGLLAQVLPNVPTLCADILPPSLCQSQGLMPYCDALIAVHQPQSHQQLEAAKRRLAFQELFCFFCGLGQLKTQRAAAPAPPMEPFSKEDFFQSLPFVPTTHQQNAMADMTQDMTSGKPMNRLVQGDVGSGKTVVAAFGGWLSSQNGYQTAMMAPTELLARQHFRTLAPLFAQFGLKVGLLTASLKAAEKRQVLAELASGDIHLVVGTHALLSQGVSFAKLGLVITDEQHRFGVEQRALLAEKSTLHPHLLVMSATPIPRTLALMVYGDLEVSIIGELPPGRSPIETYVVGEYMRERIDKFIEAQVTQGRQVYVVCPAVQEEDKEGAPTNATPLKSAISHHAHLQQEIFPHLQVGLVHGQMKATQREEAMGAFVRGETQILVSTTVIEVGVDVPNASLMVVEQGERFGLSQLHQLRGRVGRGTHQSYCVLMVSNGSGDNIPRLKALAKTNDGFAIAEEDLKLRGPGDFFGTRQHGLSALSSVHFTSGMTVIQEAKDCAQSLLSANPQLEGAEYAPLKREIGKLFEIQRSRMN